jgi:hypothetical protein
MPVILTTVAISYFLAASTLSQVTESVKVTNKNKKHTPKANDERFISHTSFFWFELIKTVFFKQG